MQIHLFITANSTNFLLLVEFEISLSHHGDWDVNPNVLNCGCGPGYGCVTIIAVTGIADAIMWIAVVAAMIFFFF